VLPGVPGPHFRIHRASDSVTAARTAGGRQRGVGLPPEPGTQRPRMARRTPRVEEQGKESVVLHTFIQLAARARMHHRNTKHVIAVLG
jgi:hypothetical protein